MTDSADLDVGDTELLDTGEEGVSIEDEDPLDRRAPDEDFGAGEEGTPLSLDFAEEGPLDPDEELRDEDLPAMDADAEVEDEGKAEEDPLLDERVAGDEPLGLPWAASPWPRVGAPLGLGALGLPGGISAITCAGRGALVAGKSGSASELLRVDLEGGRQALAARGLPRGRLVSLSADDSWVAAVSESGRLVLSQDEGASFEPVAVPEGVAVADVVFAAGILWVRTRTGSLLAARPGRVLERRVVPGLVVAMMGDGPRGIVALAADETGRLGTRVRGTDELTCTPVQALPGRAVTLGTALSSSLLGARGDHVAYATSTARGGAVLRQHGGPWQRFAWEGRVTAIAFLDDAGSLFAAVYSETDDTTGLVHVDPAGKASIVARLGAARDDADSDGRAAAVTFDDPRGVVWVAGGFGLAVFATR